MAKAAVYLTQFIATFMIVGGGIAIAGDVVVDEHNLGGWLTVVLGTGILITGARKTVKTYRQ